jgi:DNA ligase-1
MLAGKCSDVEALKYPVLISRKLDGVRATVQGGVLMSRSLKSIPNVNVQRKFSSLKEGVDGELIVGDPRAPDAYRKTVSVVMSDDKPLDWQGGDGVQYHTFDLFGAQGFEQRLKGMQSAVKGAPGVVPVEHILIANSAELEAAEADWLAQGYEGVMVRSLGGPYKQGRTSEREGYLLKLKRFEDCEAIVTGTFEQLHNGNVATTNALGRTARSSHQANKSGLGVLGGLEVTGRGGDYDGVAFCVGTGFDAQTRADLWDQRGSLIGKLAKVSYFPTGSKDRPRHPVFLGFRDRRDLTA